MPIDLIKRLNTDNKEAKNILVIGVFHGDEEQGEFLINKFLEDVNNDKGLKAGMRGDAMQKSSMPYNSMQSSAIQSGSMQSGGAQKRAELKNNLYYIPRLNSEKTRVNKNGVDLNRNFPTKNWGKDTSLAGENALDYYGGPYAASEEETKFIVSLMEKIVFDAVITLHAPYKIVNYDGNRAGEALKLAEKISEFTGYPVESDIGYPTPGSFGTYSGVERDIPTITIEMAEDVLPDELYPGFKRLFEYLETEY